MLMIDTNDMMISVTRGDYVSIVFSAVDANEDEWHPEDVGVDTLTFAVAKNHGEEPVISVSNVYNGDEDAFWNIEFGEEGSTDWYKKDSRGNVIYAGGEPAPLDFGNYVWDLQLTTSTGKITIIGKTDDVSPKFRVWGEVAQ